MKKITFIALLLICGFSVFSQQKANIHGIKNKFDQANRDKWNAFWITNPDIYLDEFAVIHFRKTFQLPEKPGEFIVHVSADNRYRLFVNGLEVCEGPQRSDLWHWRYATIDIAPYLKSGKNVIAAQVVNWGQEKAISQFSHQTAFLLQGHSEKEKIVNSEDKTWKTFYNQAFSPIHVDYFYRKHVRGYYGSNPTDSIVAEKYPWGWQDRDYDDSDWKIAAWKATPVTRETGHSMWMLTPRTISLLKQEVERHAQVDRVKGVDINKDFIKGNQPVTIPANTKASILVDHEFLTMGYPELIVSGGENAVINVLYSEALYNDNKQKENRDKIEGMHMWGIEDYFIPDGGKNRLFRPLWLRAYRYVELNIETKDEPLIIEDYYHIFSAYPLERKGSFQSNIPEHEKITDLGWQSIKICTQENLMPDAYYEQSQAAYDGRIHFNTIMYTSRDSLPLKQFIRAFDYSRIPDGLTQGYAPDHHHIMFPTFSLYWILAIHDYMMYYDDIEFVKKQLPGIQSVLTWFENRMQDNGFLGPTEWKNFIDWYATKQYDGKNGNAEPKGAPEGKSAVLSLLLSYTLNKTVEIYENTNQNPFYANKFSKWSNKINDAVYSTCFVNEKNLLADTPEKTAFSQHGNIFGVLAGAIPKDKQKAVMQNVISDEHLTQCTMPFYSNLWDALYLAEMEEKIPGLLELWFGFLQDGLTTTPERPIDSPRSDCHPWSSSPNYALPKFVAGIKSNAPGFKSVRIEPAPGNIEFFETNVPHGKGNISLKMEKKRNKTRFEVDLPDGLGGIFIFQGKEIQLKEGENKEIVF